MKFKFQFKSVFLLVAISFVISTALKAENDIAVNDGYDLVERLADLQETVADIAEQYAAITSKIDFIQQKLPEGKGTVSKEETIKNSEPNLAESYYSMLNFFSEGERESSLRSNYVTEDEFEELVVMFYHLLDSFESLSNTVSGISAQIPTINSTLQSLVNACGTLNSKMQTLNSVIEVKQDGSMSLCKSSPIIGKIEPTGTGTCWNPANYYNWDRAGSKFRVSHDAQLESITLYCDDISKIISPQNVYILTCEEIPNSSNYQFVEYNTTFINTNDFPKITYSFFRPKTIYSDRDYLVCVRRTGNNPLYPYVTSSYRGGSFYRPYGTLENIDPPPGWGQEEEPRSNHDNSENQSEQNRFEITPQMWFDCYFPGYWVETYYVGTELWSILKFAEDVSFDFSSEGLDIEKGKITVEGSEVATSANLSGMITNAFTQSPELLDAIFPTQYGKVKITQGNLSATIANNLTTNAVINITPTQVIYPRYWVEVDENGCGKVKIDTSYPVTGELTFYYMIIKR